MARSSADSRSSTAAIRWSITTFRNEREKRFSVIAITDFAAEDGVVL